jgi:hypothetical protein
VVASVNSYFQPQLIFAASIVSAFKHADSAQGLRWLSVDICGQPIDAHAAQSSSSCRFLPEPRETGYPFTSNYGLFLAWLAQNQAVFFAAVCRP